VENASEELVRWEATTPSKPSKPMWFGRMIGEPRVCDAKDHGHQNDNAGYLPIGSANS
jgi:hypothetical protein